MSEDFVPFELAKKLQEKGCSLKCLAIYTNVGILHCNESLGPHETYMDLLEMHNNQRSRGFIYDAPTISQVLKWLREDKVISVEPYASASGWRVTICRAYHQDRCDAGGGTCLKREVIGYNDGGAFEKYEEAALAGIEYVIDNLI